MSHHLLSWGGSILLGALANIAFAAVVVGSGYGRAGLQRRRLARMLGITGRNAYVQIILSNNYLGTFTRTGEDPVDAALPTDLSELRRYEARGTEDTAQGYVGPALAQTEVEAAIALRDRLTITRLPFFDEWGTKRFASIKVHIRPSHHKCDQEAGGLFEDPYNTTAGDKQANRAKAIIVIGSPAYNRVTHEILGPTIQVAEPTSEVDAATGVRIAVDGQRHARSRWAKSPHAEFLQDRSLMRWVRYGGDRTGRYPAGARSFEPVLPGILVPGRSHNPVSNGFEQSLVQQIRCGSGAGVPADLRGLTITIFAGVGGDGSAAAVKEFLYGRWNWRWVRSELRVSRDLSKRSRFRFLLPPLLRIWAPDEDEWPGSWAHWWSRYEEPRKAMRVDFSAQGGPAGKGSNHQVFSSRDFPGMTAVRAAQESREKAPFVDEVPDVPAKAPSPPAATAP